MCSLEAQQADRLAFAHGIHRRERDIARVDDHHAAAALDLDGLVGADESRRVLVEADADRERVVRQRREQAAEPVALAEVLVDDEAVGEAEARREAHAARDHRRTLVAERDHVLAQDAGARAGAADGHAVSIAQANELRDGRAAEQRRDAQLVAAGEEDSGRCFESLEPAGFVAVAPGVEVHRRDTSGTDVTEQLFVARPGLGQAAGGGNHDDVGVAVARDTHEPLEDVAVVLFVLGAADRDDPAAGSAFRDDARQRAAPSDSRTFPAGRPGHPGRGCAHR